jgi:hypothetical protein
VWSYPLEVVDESGRAQWDYAPLERVGPLRFGMSPRETTAAMEVGRYSAEPVADVGSFGPFDQQRIHFRADGSPPYRTDVTAYFVGPMGLTCIVADALSGPQIRLDGIRLVGRPPSELSAELTDHLEQTGRDVEITTDGDVCSQDLGLYPRAQRAGDVLLTRLVFGRRNDWTTTMYDCIPAEEWRVR